MGTPNALKHQDITAMQDMRDQGLSYGQIGESFGVAGSTVRFHLTKAGDPVPSSGPSALAARIRARFYGNAQPRYGR